jgi:ribonuclease BN (tRNA processing enzyme)
MCTHPEHQHSADRASNGVSRRAVMMGALAAGGLAVAAAFTQAGAAPARAATAATGDRIVPLGLDGGPRINNVPAPIASAKPSLALVVNGQTYLVDAGLDSARQLARAGLPFSALHNVFVTHHHFDHTSGLDGLVLHGWTTTNPLSDVQFWGPPSMNRQLQGIRTTFAEELALFESGGGFPPFPTVTAHEVPIAPGAHIARVMEDENVVVDATHVFHGPEVRTAYAYRFTIKSTGKVVVFSGDTAAPDDNLIALAQGADVLVHEVQDNDNVEKIVSTIPNAQQAAQLRGTAPTPMGTSRSTWCSGSTAPAICTASSTGGHTTTAAADPSARAGSTTP